MKKENEVKFEFYSEKLYQFRKENGLSQEELANKVGVSRQTIYAWESGKSIPDTENISKICQVFNITTDELANGLNPSESNKIKKMNIKKIVISIICIILVLYIILSMRKFIIMTSLKNKINNIGSYNNYHYTHMMYKMDGLKVYDSYIADVYYKDGIRKEVISQYDENLEEAVMTIIWCNYNNDEKYYFDLKNMCAEKTKINSKDIIPYEKEDAIKVMSNNAQIMNDDFVNFVVSLNPFRHISKEAGKYYIEYSTEIPNYKMKVSESICTDTGFPFAKVNSGSDGITSYDVYNNIELENVTDEDVSLPDLENYTIKEK